MNVNKNCSFKMWRPVEIGAGGAIFWPKWVLKLESPLALEN